MLSSSAYNGAVIGAQCLLKIVTRAVTIPPSNPPIIHGVAAPGVGDWAKPQVHADVATTQISSKPVLFTVPCRVIASPPSGTHPPNAFSFTAGLSLRNALSLIDILSRAV